MSYQVIQEVLEEHLQTLTGLPPLQRENTRNIGKTGEAFSRFTLLPAKTTQVSVGINGLNEMKGLAQVDLFVPQGTGVGAVNAIADAVIEHFPRGLILVRGVVNVRITVAWREAGRRIEPFYSLPLSIQWSSIA